ncbi:uncharacterized protein LOC111338619 isoform X1 [Stylophora pistillata]|uniref:uncharacterized protein LOC111338619 isoform X1 n=1 Tax=Stylophora pistillata TaxID=50429 RepID=UPI000C03C040|nr:uncharacterized protein LOC111338619 isoform X1 [Stylophora pistillata]XP_022800863.1 uncharacterized protein LOC111338619 isoform X1 [Stylophora pistillata]
MAAHSGEIYVENVNNEPFLSKRRKDPDATIRKSVVVLRTKDVRIFDDRVYMPTTIDMAHLKKAHMGQFKRDILISSNMTKIDVKETLESHFPVLSGRRFYCASVVDQRTRLEFHGERRIWDGRYIKRTIKGNSALYVFIEEDNEKGDSEHESLIEQAGMKRSFDQITTSRELTESDSGYESLREQTGIKRSFDQITTSEELTSSVSPEKMSLSSMNSPAQPSSEKLPGVLPIHDIPSLNNSSYPTLVLGQADKGAEKSEVELSNERPPMNLQQTSVTQSILLLPNTMGGVPIILVPNAGGIPVAPVLPVGNNALNTVPAQQSFEMPLLLDSDNTGLQSVPQASTLTPQLQSLDDSIASSQQSQNTVTAESSLERSLGALTTAHTTEISQQGGPESNRTDLVGGQQETENLKSGDQERQSDIENTDSFPIAEKEPESSGPSTLPTPDVEPLSSEDLGVGFETSLTSKGGSPQNVTKVKAAVKEGVYFRNVMLLKKNELASGEGKVYMPTTIEMARMRKPKTRQYQKSVQFSKDMSAEMVRSKIQETFPFLDKSGRFSCASISNQDSTLQFHGSPRVWDGKTLRRILKGNSALYIVSEESQTEIRGTRKPECTPEHLSGSKSKDTHLDEDLTIQSLPQGPAIDWDEFSLTDTVEADNRGGLSVLSDVASKIRAAVTDKKSITMIPNRSSIKGGVEFVVIFTEALPLDLSVAFAKFEDIGTVELEKKNSHNLIGKVPASLKPGLVTVRVTSTTNVYLGETLFEYWDETRDTLRRLVRDGDMQRLFFSLWAQNIDPLPPPEPLHDVSTLVREPVNESVCEGIDEATSTDSSDDENPRNVNENGCNGEDEATSSDDGDQVNESGYDGEDEATLSDDRDQGNLGDTLDCV